MTEVATPVAASQFPAGFAGEGEGDSSGSGESGAGASGGGGESGSQPAADGASAFAAERERLEATARQLQSERDRANAELARLRNAGTETGGGTTPPGLTAEAVLALMRREREFTKAETDLRGELTYADPSIFDRALDFDSVEALRKAATDSHNSIKAIAEKAVKDREAELLKPYVDRYGQLEQTPPDTSGAAATGDPTWEQLRKLSAQELDALDKDKPGLIDRVRRSATGGS